MPTDDHVLRDQLIEFLRGGNAHADLDTVVNGFPEKLYGSKPHGSPHTPWQLLEHIRITLHDLLVFSTDSNYVALAWPDEYWPSADAVPDADDWKKSVKALKADLAEFEKLIRNPQTNLYAKIPWGDGQTVLREALLAIDHTSYHLGQLVTIRKELGAWKD